jgi:uncharacterized protein YbjT (DUF2867 family)
VKPTIKRYAVIGAGSGTGLALVRHFADQQTNVRAISRHPPSAPPFIEPFTADVTDARSIAKALAGEGTSGLSAEFDAVFYTVDIHGPFKPRKEIRAAMFQGCVNAIQAAAQATVPPKFVLLSVLGPEHPTWVWWLLNAIKPGMRRNILDREQALKDSGLPYVICRAPRLNDDPGGKVPLGATPPQHKLDMKMTISRTDLAQALIQAAQQAPKNTTWDVFSSAAGAKPQWLTT